MRQISRCSTLACTAVLLLLSTACTIKATTNQIIDTTSNITGTTSGFAWFDEDGILRPDHKIIAFTSLNHADLEQDLARGQGEYLTSLGTLLGVADDRQATFRSNAQDAFGTLVSSDQAARVTHFRTLAR